MKQLLITLSLITYALLAFGQEAYILNENFTSNQNGWTLSSNTNRSFEIRNGYFYFDAAKSWVNTLNSPIDESRNFEIETKIYKIGGATDMGFGLAFGRKDNENMFEFDISSNGYYRVMKFTNGSSTNLIEWTVNSNIRKGNASTNILKVVKEGSYFKYYINGVYVNQSFYEKLPGDYVGFAIWNNQKIKIDYLRIKYKGGSSTGNTILNETFSSNRNGWKTGYKGSNSFNIRNGKYVLDLKESDFVFNETTLSSTGNFEIETKLKRLSGQKDRGIGVIWGAKDPSNYYEVSITATGFYRVSEVRNGVFKELIAWASSSLVKKGYYADNILKIIKTGNSHKFYINGTYVNQISNQYLFGTDVGFIGFLNQKIEIDYIKISGDGGTNIKTNTTNIKRDNTIGSTVFYDGFRDNSKGWTIGNNTDAMYNISNGYFEFEHKRTEGSWWNTNKIQLDESKDFMIETSIQRVSGAEGYGYGLVWGRRDNNNQFEFALSSNGYYRIAKSVGGEWEAIHKWTISSAVKKEVYTTNKITLKKIGNTLQYYVNDTYLGSEPYEPFFGTSMGFFVYKQQKIKVDYLKVSYLGEETKTTVNRPVITWKKPSSYTLKTKSPYQMLNACIASKEKPSSIALYVDGKRQSNRDFNIVPTSKTCDYTWKMPIEFDQDGKYTLKLEVTNSGGTSTSTRYIEYTPERTTSNNTTNNTNTKKQKRLALLIGNASYSHGGNLGNPLNDVRSMKTTLENLGFTVLKYENCTQSTIKRAMDEFGTKLKNHDIGLFFYAGHGVQVNGANYLIPTDAKLQSAKDVEYDCVRAGRILAKMEDAGTRTNIVILDACRDNPFERSWSRSTQGKGLAFMNAPIGSLVAYATSPGNVASDGEGSNGLYTESLLKYINMPNVTIEQLFKKVRTAVIEKSNGKQVPWESTSLRGNFYFKE